MSFSGSTCLPNAIVDSMNGIDRVEKRTMGMYGYTRLCMYLDDVTIYFSQNRLYSIHVDNNGVCLHSFLLIAMLTAYFGAGSDNTIHLRSL
jgi:hypothetical protein